VRPALELLTIAITPDFANPFLSPATVENKEVSAESGTAVIIFCRGIFSSFPHEINQRQSLLHTRDHEENAAYTYCPHLAMYSMTLRKQ